MAKHKITPEMDHALKQFAERLPEQDSTMVGRPLTGAELLEKYPDIKGPNGKKVDPGKKYYCANLTTATNHLRRLRKAYAKGGKDAVVEYLQPFAKFLGTPETEAAQ